MLINCKGCADRCYKGNMRHYDTEPNPGWYCSLCAYGIERRLARIAKATS